ncbi:hypothetical protein ACJ73_10196 [Blastomyces percursus]|uniref:C2H2-type domain-containing protein n=1 Tax=Blastomyces percursus TaxID=1658174 RepID=A0A1J9NZQ8_9EURO|nr:hypothetical protein ACJ73_10196 [Blastomyces percursus]
MDMLCSMSRSIDPRRPWKLTTQESRSINDLPRIKILQANMVALKDIRDKAAAEHYEIWDDRLREAQRHLLNEKQRAKSQLKRHKLDKYNREQPVIDSERQLSGKVVDEEVKSALERTEYMSPEQLQLIDAILTLPGRSWEAEQQRRINAINKVTMYCGVEEGSLCFRSPAQPRPTIRAPISVEQPLIQPPELPVQQAIRKVMKEKRPKICFLCLQNSKLPVPQRIHSFKRPGELTKHFERKHLRKFQRLTCKHCHIAIDTLADLLNHAEFSHGTVTRNPKYRKLCGRLY